MEKIATLKALSAEELNQKLTEKTEELRILKASHAVTPLENPMRIRKVRRTIAQLYTCLALKALAKDTPTQAEDPLK